MRSEKSHLIHDLLETDAGEVQREAIISAGSTLLHRRRRHRAWRRGVLVASVALTGVLLYQQIVPHRSVERAMPVAAKPAPLRVHSLTDEELLSLFPHTPVGLITLKDGRKRLIFLRPGDEQKHLTRL